MKLNCLVHTCEFRGDHPTDVALAVEPLPDETVHAFLMRVIGPPGQYHDIYTDKVEIRIVREAP